MFVNMLILVNMVYDSGEFSDFGEYDKTGDSGESDVLLEFHNSCC